MQILCFQKRRRAQDAYQLEIEEYIEDLSNYSSYVDEVHSVGGLHPEWGIDTTLNCLVGHEKNSLMFISKH